MRILFLTHQYFPRYTGGTETLVHGLAKRLQSAGHEAQVLSYRESPSGILADHGFRRDEHDGVPLWELSGNISCTQNPAEAEHDNRLTAALVVRAAKLIKPDVIHAAHVMKLSAAVLPTLRAEGYPIVTTLSDYWWVCLRHTLMKFDGSVCTSGPDHRFRCLKCAQAQHGFALPSGSPPSSEAELQMLAEQAEREPDFTDNRFRQEILALASRNGKIRSALLSANRIIALSDFLKLKLVEQGYPEDRIEVVHHGVETTPLEQAREQQQNAPGLPPRIVFLGTLAPHKGPHILLEALRAAPDARVKIDFYGGPGVDKTYGERLSELAEGDERVRFCGLVAPERLGEAFLGSSAMALPAQWYENDPLVVKAALHARVPVAASRIGSLEQLISDSRHGWLLPPDDVQAWASWLRQISIHPPGRVPEDLPVPTADSFFSQMMPIYQSLV